MAKLFENGKEDIAYLSDIGDVATVQHGASQGNIPIFGEAGVLQDSGKSPSDFAEKSEIAPAVSEAVSYIWDAIRNEYAVAGYLADEWTSGREYAEGDFCARGGAGYRCLVANSDASFNASKWTLVLSVSGRNYIDDLLQNYDKEGLAALADIAPEYSASDTYAVDDIVVKDGDLQTCTVAGRGPAATFEAGATVASYVKAKLGNVAAISDIAPEYSASGTYAVDDIVVKDGVLQQCTVAGTGPAATFRAGATVESYVKAKVDALAQALSEHVDDAEVHVSQNDRSNWDGKLDNTQLPDTTIGDSPNGWRVVTQGNGPSGEPVLREWVFARPFIQTDQNTVARLRDIPASLTVDRTLSVSGAAADAKSVGDALADKVGIDNLPYEVKNVDADVSDDAGVVVFSLSDRTVNVLSATVSFGQTIRLVPPSQTVVAGKNLARDFYVVVSVSASADVSMSLYGTSLIDYEGGTPDLVAVAGQTVAYRFTECSTNGLRFLVTCLADPAYRYVKEIERALDAILEMAGYTPDIEKGVFVPEQDDPTVVHRIVVVPDSDTGEATLKVDQDESDT